MLCIIIIPSSVFAQPKAAFTSNVTSGCSPLVVQFNDASAGNPTQWKWNLGNGTITTVHNPGSVYINPGTYTVKLTVKNSAGIDSVTKTNYITVYAQPDVDFNATPLTGCPPFDVKFTDKSIAVSGTIDEYIWDFGDGEISTDKNPLHTYKTSDTFSVALTVRNTEGCRKTLQKPALVTVLPVVKANFNYQYVNACKAPTPVIFENTSTPKDHVTYQWVFGDGGNTNEENPTHIYTKAGSYDVHLLTVNEAGCSDIATQTISIGNVIADFSLQAGSCANEQLFFTNTSSPKPVAVSWTFGDNTISTAKNPVYVYKAAGNYTVTMTADFGTCTNSITKTVIVENKPKAGFTSTGGGTCKYPVDVTFTNNSTGAASYMWDFGDGTTATGTNPIHTYTKPGFYNVMLIALNVNGCSDTLIKNNEVKLGPPKITGINGLPVSNCSPYTIKPKAEVNAPEPVTKYQWDFGDSSTSNETEPEHTYVKAGTYDVKLIIQTAEGCGDTLLLKSAVQLGQPPNANIVKNLPPVVCSSTEIHFTDASTGTVTSWEWNFGDGTISTDKNPVHRYQDTGSFQVILHVKSQGCKNDYTYPGIIKVKSPVAKFEMITDCSKKLSPTFHDLSIGATKWSWDFGDSKTSTEQSPVHTYASAGQYAVTLTVVNGECTDEIKDTVLIIDEHPDFTFSPAQTTICRNKEIVFAGTNYYKPNISLISWEFGDGTTTGSGRNNDTVTHTYNIAGTFSPIMIWRDRAGCRDTVKKKDLKFTVYGATASFTNVSGTCINNTITFTNRSFTDSIHPIIKYDWFYGDGKTESLTKDPFQHRYDSAGSFDVKLIIEDSYGCTDSMKISRDVTITKPVADFVVSDSIKCSYNKDNFIDSSKGLHLKYYWQFGDGNYSNEQNPLHYYSTQGVYNISLKITDKYGCVDSLTRDSLVTISNPKAAFTLKDTFTVCPPLLIQPLNKSTGYSYLTWYFGDGNTSEITDPAHLYTTAGNFTIQLITKGYGKCYDTANKTILIKGPSGNFTYDPLKGCNPTTISFTATTKNTIGYTWDFSDGNIESTKKPFVKHTYNEGKFVPKLVLIDSSGCQVGMANKDTIVIAQVNAYFVSQVKQGCDSTLVLFSDSSIGDNTNLAKFQWSFGDKSFDSTHNTAHYYYKTKDYKVTLNVTSADGCKDSITIPLTIQVNQKPIISIAAPDSACINTTVTLKGLNTTTIDTATKWTWHIDNANTQNTQAISQQFNTAQTHQILLSAANKFGCTDTATHNITVLNVPTVDAGADTIICLGNKKTLQATGAATYIWLADTTLSCTNCADPQVNPVTQTTYYVKGYNSFGCSSGDSVIVRVSQPFNLYVSEDESVCVGETTRLNASGADVYNWSPSIYLSNPSSQEPLFTAVKDTSITYTLTANDSAKCFTEAANVTVKAYPKPQMTVELNKLQVNVGESVRLQVKSSPDITQWLWTPPRWLDDPTSAQPVATPLESINYTVVGTNGGGCVARQNITITVLCNNANIFIPNTFSPNNDGMNDVFYPRGHGLFSIQTMRIFNRWGEVVFERTNFDPNNPSYGWNGMYHGKPADAGVYIYVIQVLCNNNTLIPVKGDVTLLR